MKNIIYTIWHKLSEWVKKLFDDDDFPDPGFGVGV